MSVPAYLSSLKRLRACRKKRKALIASYKDELVDAESRAKALLYEMACNGVYNEEEGVYLKLTPTPKKIKLTLQEARETILEAIDEVTITDVERQKQMELGDAFESATLEGLTRQLHPRRKPLNLSQEEVKVDILVKKGRLSKEIMDEEGLHVCKKYVSLKTALCDAKKDSAEEIKKEVNFMESVSNEVKRAFSSAAEEEGEEEESYVMQGFDEDGEASTLKHTQLHPRRNMKQNTNEGEEGEETEFSAKALLRRAEEKVGPAVEGIVEREGNTFEKLKAAKESIADFVLA